MMFLTLLAFAAAQDPRLNCEDPQYQQEMNLCAHRDFEAADAELNRVYRQAIASQRQADREIEASDPGPRYEETLRAAQRAWVAFREAQCQLEGMEEARGGSMEPMVRSGCLTQMTRARIAQLNGSGQPAE